MSFLKPKMPEVRPAPRPAPLPERSDAETARLAEMQRSAFFRRGGRASTSLTGGTGADSGYAATSFLGGAAKT
jgi:hypothetical protein